MGLYFLIAVLINIFLAYTRFFIVIEERRAFDAITASANMALENLGVTIKLYTTLLLVYVRTILTVCIFILFPFIISAILTYAAVAWVKIILLSVLLIMVGIFMVFVSHLNSVLEIFVETLWYRAYKDNKSRSISAEISHDHTGAETHHA